MTARMSLTILLALALDARHALAQQSASYKLQESVLNSGGHPIAGTTLSSASFHVNLDSIGDGVVEMGFASTNFHMDGSFAFDYRPPGEVRNVRFLGQRFLTWDFEPSVGKYEVYRSLVSALPGGFGSCDSTQGVSFPSWDTAGLFPPVGQGYFYLVTARNRLNEEGTKGFTSSGMQRSNTAPCP